MSPDNTCGDSVNIVQRRLAEMSAELKAIVEEYK
jgi:hypothetical protein